MRRQYPFHLIEPKWQQVWDEQKTFRAWNPGDEIPAEHAFAKRHNLSGTISAAALPQKYYILDMFPYPSGAGLHVGHPEGYTATDILARYRRALGFNVLHPMGWDAFGLPAEQYAIRTGQHPRKTTEANVANFTKQIKSLGFSYDWSREVNTTDPNYFKWTQWIFLKLYNSWFNPDTNKAESIEILEDVMSENPRREWTKGEYGEYVSGLRNGYVLASLEKRQAQFRREQIDKHRLAYVSEQPVWWCEDLGTVLANEEVVDGKSEVGGFPVTRKPMRQWMLRISQYAERLLADLDTIDWSGSLKEMQRNWIGRSEGATVKFQIDIPGPSSLSMDVFTTRPDTLFGATYMVVAPEHWLIDNIHAFANRNYRVNDEITSPTVRIFNDESAETITLADALTKAKARGVDLIEVNPNVNPPACILQDYGKHRFYNQEVSKQVKAIQDYRKQVASKSDLERTELAKEKTGVFTGAYAINPVNGKQIPIWIADYVLASYGTGAIMAVPAHDTRDFEFAKKFNLQIVIVVQAPGEENSVGFVGDGISVNSDFISGLPTPEAKKKIIAWLEEKGLGKKTINYKLRDWLFSRQRYWGEPFPIIWKKDAQGNLYHEALPEKSLPLLPPVLHDYKPTSSGEPPLARAKDWVELKNGAIRETNTMPQWAGSCWYYLRYLDSQNEKRFVNREAELYWMGGERPAGVFPLLSSDEWHTQVENLRQRAFADGKRPPFAVEFALVSPTLERLIKETSDMDVSEFRHSMDVYAVRHIFNEHGIAAFEEARGNVAVTLDDLERLPEILAEPDAVEFSAPHPGGLKRFLITKRVNGVIYVVEELRGKHALLQLITMYKKKATARDVAPKAPLSDTSKTFRRTGENINPPSAIRNPQFTTPGVDLYVGGIEHAVLHLLYARFWHKVLFDLGYVSTPEPFFKLVNQGLILGEDGQKMSKSRGNVVNPDDIMGEYGADAFRLYEMFMGPLEMVKPWNTKGVEGVYRFLGRAWRLFVDEASETEYEQNATAEGQESVALLEKIQLSAAIKDVAPTPAQLKTLHTAIKKVTEDLDGFRFNTAISALMIFVNDAIGWETKPVSVLRDFLILLAPFAPHLSEELFAKLSQAQSPKPKVSETADSAKTLDLGPWTLDSLSYQPWPKFDPALLVEDTLEIPIQINGKLRDLLVVSAKATQAELEAAALASEKIKSLLEGKPIKKVIVVPKKLVNIVA